MTMSSRPSIIVAGLIVATTIATASTRKGQLILSLAAVLSKVTWFAALEAQTIFRTKRSIVLNSLSSWLPRWWRRQMWCSIVVLWHRGIRTEHIVGNPDSTLL